MNWLKLTLLFGALGATVYIAGVIIGEIKKEISEEVYSR